MSWMVVLDQPAVVERYPGRIENTRAAAEPYRQQLRATQRTLETQIEALNIRVTGSVQHLGNAIFVRATPDRIDALRALPGVKAVIPMRRVHLLDQLSLSNVQQAWTEANIGGQSNAGAGLKIGVIDTGIDQTHPSFHDASLSVPSGFPKCDVPSNCAFTNNKVIVARSYVSTLTAGSNPSDPAADSRPDDLSARDRIGHGTAVSSVVAGVPGLARGVAISGVAPKAWLGNYKVFGSSEVNSGASEQGLMEALDDAVADGMDVVNLSSGSPPFSGPLDTGTVCGLPSGQACDPLAAAVEQAMTNGQTIVVAAAGNSGSDGAQNAANGAATYGTIASPAYAPSVIAAGGIENDIAFSRSVTISGSGVPSNLAQLVAFPSGDGPTPGAPLTAPLVDVTQLGDSTGLFCNPLPAGALQNDIALVSRGTCTFAIKVTNAQSAGAVGVILINNSADPSTLTGWGGLSATQIPAYMISESDGQNLKSFIDGQSGVKATMDNKVLEPAASTVGLVPGAVASFASRGPATGTYGLKPDVSAVATSFLLAAESFDPYGDVYSQDGYTVADGTSFATPMLAGAAALVKQASPNLTPLQVKSTLVNTATLNNVLNQSGTGPASIYDVGSGLLQAQNAVVSKIVFVPATVSFGLLHGFSPSPQTITVTNSSGAAVNLTITVAEPAGAGATQILVNNSTSTSLPLGAGQSSSFSVSLTGGIPSSGRYAGLINITGAGAPLQIPYQFLVGSTTVYDIVPIIGPAFDGPINQELPAGEGPLGVRIIDQYGAAVANTAVRWGVARGGGSVVPGAQNTSTRTDQNGIAFATVNLGPTIGDQQFTVTAGSVTYTFDGNGRAVPAINSGGIVDAASYTAARAVAPGSIISVFGSALADNSASAPSLPLPLGINNVAFSFDVPAANISLPGYFFYVSPNQINLQVPWELAGQSSAIVKVIINYTYSAEYTLRLATYSPGFFSNSSGGQLVAAALDASNSPVSASNPVARGSVAQLYMNGLGPVNNRPADGAAVNNAQSTTTSNPSITIGGQPATVIYSGLAPGFAALYQVNVTVPTGIGTGAQPITCSIGGVTCQTVSLYVK